MLPVIRESWRFGAGAMVALASLSSILSEGALGRTIGDAALQRPADVRITRRIDALNASNFGCDFAGTLAILAPSFDSSLETALRAPYNPGSQGLGRVNGAAVALAAVDEIVLQRGTADENCRVIYRSDFDSQLPEKLRGEWSYGEVRETPDGRRFLGTIGNGATTLTVNNAPKDGAYVIQFDLLAIGSWEGNRSGTGSPQVWGLRVVDGPTLVETNFATRPGATQAYPDAVGRSDFEAGYQAVEAFELPGGKLATVYRLTYRFNRTDASTGSGSDDVRIEFFARGLSGGSEAPVWGLTNVVLALVTDSGAGGGGGGGFGGTGGDFHLAYNGSNFDLMPAGASSPGQTSTPKKDDKTADRNPDKPTDRDPAVPAPSSVLLLGAAAAMAGRRKR